MTQRTAGVVLLHRIVETSHERCVEDCSGQCEADEEETADRGDDGSGKAAETAEQREDTDEDLDDGGDNCDDVGDEHPFGGFLVCVQSGTQLVAE